MKLTNTQNMKSKSGMTLLELTVVILVLLSLISILFIGARAWKKGSDRAGCILNIRNTQQAVRGFMNMHDNTLPTANADIFGATGYIKEPICPSDTAATKTITTSYTYSAAAVNTTATTAGANLALTCKIDATTHVPTDAASW